MSPKLAVSSAGEQLCHAGSGRRRPCLDASEIAELLAKSEACYPRIVGGSVIAEVDDTNLESEDWEEYFEPPKLRGLHRAVRLDPEAAWDELRALLCRRMWRRRDLDTRTDLMSDLMFWHADAFIDRVEQLADECRHARDIIAMAQVGGRRETPGLVRYSALQEALQQGWTRRSN